jgi:hypothetical protein
MECAPASVRARTFAPLARSMADGQDSPGTRIRSPAAPPSAARSAARALLRSRQALPAGATSNGQYREQATCVSFQMDGLPLSPAEFRAAMAGGAARTCRTRSAQRVRNHVAILRRVESLLRSNRPLQRADVIRWYTSIAGGLSAGGIADGMIGRLDRIVSAVNSPRLRFWPAVKDVAALHVDLLADPFVPGFNGILARLLLRYHMGRCGLPPVVFDPATDPPRLTSVPKLEPRLLELIAHSYDENGQSGQS